MGDSRESMDQIVDELPYYRMFETVPFEEDYLNEFKGHRSITTDEIPPICMRPRPGTASKNSMFRNRQSRQSVSKAINAFINTGKGGCVYLGVTDGGLVLGIQLTLDQQEHIMISVTDLLERYKPPVHKGRCRVRFVPVLIEKQTVSVVQILEKKRKEFISKGRSHELRTHKWCWCDVECEAKMAHCKFPAPYIVEIRVEPFKQPPIEEKSLSYDYMKYFYPIHRSEENECYFRREGSVNMFSLQEIYAISSAEAQKFCLELINNLTKKRDELLKNRN